MILLCQIITIFRCPVFPVFVSDSGPASPHIDPQGGAPFDLDASSDGTGVSPCPSGEQLIPLCLLRQNVIQILQLDIVAMSFGVFNVRSHVSLNILSFASDCCEMCRTLLANTINTSSSNSSYINVPCVAGSFVRFRSNNVICIRCNITLTLFNRRFFCNSSNIFNAFFSTQKTL